MSIWQFNKNIMNWLLQWNIINILIGVLLALKGGIWRGIGTQNIGWGIINVLIAFFGMAMTERRQQSLENPHNPAILGEETRNMRRLLQVNSLLDILYIIGGWRFSRRNKGAGIGIMIQGALLFIWDAILLMIMPDEPQI